MSHIPSSAMKHAGPVHHDSEADKSTRKAPTSGSSTQKGDATEGSGIGTGAWIAIGGTLLAGAAAAIAVPLLRARATPVPTRRGKKATPKKAGPRKTADGKAGGSKTGG